jgi:hypothetical protein
MSNIEDVITVDDVIDHLGIDYADDMVTRNINRAIRSADGQLRESVSENYPVDHPLTKDLALIYASNAYENRGDISLSNNERKLSSDIAMKLRLYLRRVSNG